MKKQWTEWVDALDPSCLEEPELDEQEMEELTRPVDLARIRQKALHGIKGDKKPAGKRIRRIAAIALAAALACVGTGLALKRGALEQFFNIDATLGEEQVTRVGQSQVQDGIRLTLEDVIQGQQDAVAVLSLAREDGEPFPPGATLKNLNLRIKGKETISGYAQSSRMSEDQRTLQVAVKLDNSETPLQGETLQLEAGLLYAIEDRDAQKALDLEGIYRRSPVRISTAEQGLRGADATELAQAFQQAVSAQMTGEERRLDIAGPEFAGLGFVDGQLWLGIQYPEDRTILSNSAAIYTLCDSRTGAEYHFQHNYSTDGELDGPQLAAYLFEGLAPEDLPYLTMVVSYALPSVLSEGQWSLAYTFTGEPLTERWEMDHMLQTPGGSVALTRMECSAVGVKFYGQWLREEEQSGAPRIQPAMALVLEDGEKLPLQFRGSVFNSQDGKYFFLEYILPEGAGQTGYFDQETLAAVRSVEIDGARAAITRR